MGMFSFKCKVCNQSVRMGEEVVRITTGGYDGYGGNAAEYGGGAYFHAKCFKEKIGEDLFETLTGESSFAADQGFGPARKEFVS